MPLANVHYSMLTARNGITRVSNVVSVGSWSNSALGISANSVQLRRGVNNDSLNAILYPPSGRSASYGPFMDRTFQGESYGYFSGGAPAGPVDYFGSTPYEKVYGGTIGPKANTIQKFPFSSDLGISINGVLTVGRYGTSSTGSKTHGYTAGGFTSAPPISSFDVIDKFSFSSDANATDVGETSIARSHMASAFSTVAGYAMGGASATPANLPNNSQIDYTDIDKYPFSSDTPATDIGNLTSGKMYPAGHSSTTHGYSSGGEFNPGESLVIDKFSFSSDVGGTNIGSLSLARAGGAGISSTTNGYNLAGMTGPGSATDVVDKFPFSSDTNATDIAELSNYNDFNAAISSTERGYYNSAPNNGQSATITYFNYVSDTTYANRTQGITEAVSRTSGTQV